MKQNTTRFSDRVEDYIKYRPTYPDALLKILVNQLHLYPDNVVADIGSGTGISSIPFLKNTNTVFGVEPNKEMRQAAQQLLSSYPNFRSIDGKAEKTNLRDKSIDIIFCGQAFHWFNKLESKEEFKRILKKEGHIVLAWNSRCTKSDFQQEYENALLQYIDEYKFVSHRNISEEEIRNFFLPKQMSVESLANKQQLTLEGLKGKLLSSSYCPKAGLIHEKLMKEMERMYKIYERDNKIEFEYETQLYWC
jgi:ubiquinone/menaquinone biosynthesis C-methylase UbiE